MQCVPNNISCVCTCQWTGVLIDAKKYFVFTSFNFPTPYSVTPFTSYQVDGLYHLEKKIKPKWELWSGCACRVCSVFRVHVPPSPETLELYWPSFCIVTLLTFCGIITRIVSPGNSAKNAWGYFLRYEWIASAWNTIVALYLGVSRVVDLYFHREGGG